MPGLYDECFLATITRQAIRRGAFTSVADLSAAIATCVEGWSEDVNRFAWTKTADGLIDTINQAKPKQAVLQTTRGAVRIDGGHAEYRVPGHIRRFGEHPIRNHPGRHDPNR